MNPQTDVQISVFERKTKREPRQTVETQARMETLSWLKIKSEMGHNPPPTRFLNVCTSL